MMHKCSLQGMVAGLNAARRAQELAPVTIPRNTSYIGTLIDDLVTKVGPILQSDIIWLCCITAAANELAFAASGRHLSCRGPPVSLCLFYIMQHV